MCTGHFFLLLQMTHSVIFHRRTVSWGPFPTSYNRDSLLSAPQHHTFIYFIKSTNLCCCVTLLILYAEKLIALTFNFCSLCSVTNIWWNLDFMPNNSSIFFSSKSVWLYSKYNPINLYFAVSPGNLPGSENDTRLWINLPNSPLIFPPICCTLQFRCGLSLKGWAALKHATQVEVPKQK